MAKSSRVPRSLALLVAGLGIVFVYSDVGRGVPRVAAQPGTGNGLAANAGDFRKQLQRIYTQELGVTEASGHNDGDRIETYLRYTHLGKGHDWCSSFVSWVYAQAGRTQPRNPWSPALFPKARVIWGRGCNTTTCPQTGDVFGIWNNSLGRIAHVGFIDQWTEPYALTTEGNSNNAVERRRRSVRGIDRVADWTR